MAYYDIAYEYEYIAYGYINIGYTIDIIYMNILHMAYDLLSLENRTSK
jgi:hypothetical protein